MRILFWLTLAAAAAFAVLLGLYVQSWTDDVYPMNIVFFGHRLAVFLTLGFGIILFAFAALTLSLRRGRREAVADPVAHLPPVAVTPIDCLFPPVRPVGRTASTCDSGMEKERSAA